MRFIDIYWRFVDIFISCHLLNLMIFMKAEPTTKARKNPFAFIACKLFGCTYRITRRYESNIKEFECAHCKKQFTLDGYGNYTPLTPKLRRVNEVYENFYLRRVAR